MNPTALASTEYSLYHINGRYHLYMDGVVCFEAETPEELQCQLTRFYQAQAQNIAMWLIEDLLDHANRPFQA
jgi:hypothetical protein